MINVQQLRHTQISKIHLAALVLVAFLLRASVFEWYLQHNSRYRQPDSFDYHYITVGLAHQKGIVRLDSGAPIFWRTPGYAYFLNPFFKQRRSVNFEDYQQDHTKALWLQIILCSFLPLLIFFLALHMTQTLPIAWAAAWISVIHPGFVLASGYLLTDALAHLIFTIFLLYFYQACYITTDDTQKKSDRTVFVLLICAAFFLGVYSWFRPIGRYFMFVSCALLAISNTSFKNKLLRICAFALVFFVMIAPWCVRNYQLTGTYFFCPMSGPYLQTFVAPKIIRAVHGTPLLEAINTLNKEAFIACTEQQKITDVVHPGKTYPQEFACLDIALPWCFNHPFYFAQEWLREVMKTTFDLYTTQFVAFTNNTFSYDPPEEFITEKLADALYKARLPLFMRLIIWLEALFMILLWIGFLLGFWWYLLMPLLQLIQKKRLDVQTAQRLDTWLKATFFIGGMLIMTGGFGYARLRMPIDPLIIILSLTYWYNVWKFYMPHGAKNL